MVWKTGRDGETEIAETTVSTDGRQIPVDSRRSKDHTEDSYDLTEVLTVDGESLLHLGIYLSQTLNALYHFVGLIDQSSYSYT